MGLEGTDEDTEVQRSNSPEVTKLEQSPGLPTPSLRFLFLLITSGEFKLLEMPQVLLNFELMNLLMNE